MQSSNGDTDATHNGRCAVRPTGCCGRTRIRPVANLVGAALAAVLLCVYVVPQAAARTAPDSFADLAARLLPSVVNISTTQNITRKEGGNLEVPRFPPGSPFEEFFREFFERQQRRGQPQRRRATSLGSGFIIGSSGYVVTNNHVIAEADEITVTLHDDSKLTAKVVGRDQKTDLALLKVEPPKPLKAVPLGDSDRTRVGDWIVAIGNPFGLGGTVTAGIVSARKRDINSGPYDDFIQTDASINRGNSGGPMFNLKGEVIGINTAIFSPSGGSVGIGFAIPSNLARPILDQLRQFGRARRGWLGVRIQTVTDEIAQGLGLEHATGALVANVTEKSPAAKGKVNVGDVILRFDNRPVTEMRRLPRIVAETTVGRDVDVVVWRQGKEVRLKIKLGEFPDDPEATAAATPKSGDPSEGSSTVAELGLVLATVNDELRQRFNLPEDATGVVVTKVIDGSPAAEKRIRPGDLIRKIGPSQRKVSRPSQVKTQVDKAVEAKMKSILMLVETGGNQRFVAVQVGKG